MSSNRRNPLQPQDDLEPVEEARELLAKRQLRITDRPTSIRDRSWDARRTKMTFDLPPELIERIRLLWKELAQTYPNARIRISDVARMLLDEGLTQLDEGVLEIRPATVQEARREDTLGQTPDS